MKLQSKTNDALHSLLDTSIDGFKGYTTAVENCEAASPEMLRYLRTSKAECGKAAGELRELLRESGESADDDGTATGALHRGWIATRTAFSRDDEAALASEIVRGEEHAEKQYVDALEKIAEPSVRNVVQSQLSGLRENLIKARALEAAHQA